MVYVMDKKTAKLIVDKLAGIFTDKPALNFNTPYELLVAVILSAQCTDERVNKITEKLFKDYNTPNKMLTLSQEQLEKYIFSCGLYKSKANEQFALRGLYFHGSQGLPHGRQIRIYGKL